ncbi:MAG: hypothetical protein Hals2KO_38700 [Halioglobus sp.]
MSKRAILWLVPALLYAAFFSWYTDFDGPLSEDEVDAYLFTMVRNGAQPEMLALVERFARQDSGRQFLMVNNIDLNETPPSVTGAEPGESASELMGRYMQHMLPALLAHASHPVLMGVAVYPAMDLVGIEGAEEWDQGALVRYRSRRTFLEIVTNPVFQGKHHFKTAALQKTIAYPIETRLYLSDLRLLLALVLLAFTALADALLLSRRR